jgi:hypothetical protein
VFGALAFGVAFGAPVFEVLAFGALVFVVLPQPTSVSAQSATKIRVIDRAPAVPRSDPSLKHHVEGPRSRPANPRKPAFANDLRELGLTGLRTQAFGDFLVQ